MIYNFLVPFGLFTSHLGYFKLLRFIEFNKVNNYRITTKGKLETAIFILGRVTGVFLSLYAMELVLIPVQKVPSPRCHLLSGARVESFCSPSPDLPTAWTDTVNLWMWFHLLTAWKGEYLLCLSASGPPDPLLCTDCFYYQWIMF